MKKVLVSFLAIAGLCLCALPALLQPFKADVSVSTIDTTKTGSITIHKYEQAGEISGDLVHDGTIQDESTFEGKAPLKDVEFTVYYLGDNIGTDNYITTVAQAEEYVETNNVTGEVKTTGTDGIAAFTGLKLGQYLVVETNAPENVSEKTPSFIVNVPTTVTIDNVDQWLYDIHVYPKNQTIYGSVILNKVDENNNPLAGAVFSLYAVGPDGIVGTEDDVLRAEELAVNENGQLAVSGLPKGNYYFVETKAPENYGLNPTPQRFEITTSGTVKLDGTTYVLDEGTIVEITVENNKEPDIHKGVKTVENQYAGYDFGEGHEWVISPDVPKDISTYSKYVVKDTIDENLIFSGLDTVKVYTGGTFAADKSYSGGTQLTAGTDYQVSYDDATRTLVVSFIEGDFKGGQTALNGVDELYVFFETTFDETKVSLGSDYPNQATLEYNNGFTDDKEKESETPKVHTGGLSLYKYTVNAGQAFPLAGAEFRLAVSEENAKQGIFIKNADGSDIIATSDENGVVKFTGIAYGEDGDSAEAGRSEYWLVETKAPEVNGTKYNLMNSAYKVIIDVDSHNVPVDNVFSPDSWEVSVINKTGIWLPTTGGIGNLPFYIIGLIIMGTAVVIAVKSSKKKQNA